MSQHPISLLLRGIFKAHQRDMELALGIRRAFCLRVELRSERGIGVRVLFPDLFVCEG